MEEYRKCYEDYEISNLGNCRRLLKNGNYKEVNGSILTSGGGYRYVQLKRENKKTNLLFHHLVAKVFIGERPNNMVIDHIDRNPKNNNVSNLRYVSQLENCRNNARYHTDLKEKDDKKKRHLELSNNYRKKNKENKTYECKSCLRLLEVKNGGIFCSKPKYDNHEKSKHHLKRLKFISLMEGNDIEVNHINYKRIKNNIIDYKRGRRKTEPLIYF
jgi:predicted ABC-class ATPase